MSNTKPVISSAKYLMIYDVLMNDKRVPLMRKYKLFNNKETAIEFHSTYKDKMKDREIVHFEIHLANEFKSWKV